MTLNEVIERVKAEIDKWRKIRKERDLYMRACEKLEARIEVLENYIRDLGGDPAKAEVKDE